MIQKNKIERLVQELEKKKGRLAEKDVVIEGLRFEVEKLGLKIQGLEKYKDLHSPVYMSVIKKELKKPLSIDPTTINLQLNPPPLITTTNNNA